MSGHAVEIRAGGSGGRGGIGHLVGAGGGDANLRDGDREHVRHHLRHLDVEPLPHLGAAMIDLDRAVRIDMDQRAGLVEMRGGEADPEFDGGERYAFLEDRAVRVERFHGLSPRVIIGRLAQAGDQLRHDIVGDGHAIRRHVAAGAVEIGEADRQRIAPRCAATSSMIRSIAIMPCGPPKPRKAVAETMLVLSRSERISMSGDNSNCRHGTSPGR